MNTKEAPISTTQAMNRLGILTAENYNRALTSHSSHFVWQLGPNDNDISDLGIVPQIGWKSGIESEAPDRDSPTLVAYSSPDSFEYFLPKNVHQPIRIISTQPYNLLGTTFTASLVTPDQIWTIRPFISPSSSGYEVNNYWSSHILEGNAYVLIRVGDSKSWIAVLPQRLIADTKSGSSYSIIPFHEQSFFTRAVADNFGADFLPPKELMDSFINNLRA